MQLTKTNYGKVGGAVATAALIRLAGQAAMKGAAQLGKNGANRIVKKKSRGGSSRDIGDPDIITTQNDTNLRYLKGKLSKAERRKIKFTKKVRNAVFSDVGLRSFVSSVGGARKVVNANVQGYFGTLLGGIGQNDNDEFRTAFRVAFENATGTIGDFTNRKVMVKSMCLDMHVTNSGSNTIELDVYQLSMRRDWPGNDSLTTMFDNSWTDAATGSGYGRVISLPGVTPFQNSNFCEHFKVLSKRSILMSAGQSTSLQMRCGRKFVEGKALQRYQGGIPGYTKGYFIMFRGVPRWTGLVVERGASELVWTQERTMTVARNADGQNVDVTSTL